MHPFDWAEKTLAWLVGLCFGATWKTACVFLLGRMYGLLLLKPPMSGFKQATLSGKKMLRTFHDMTLWEFFFIVCSVLKRLLASFRLTSKMFKLFTNVMSNHGIKYRIRFSHDSMSASQARWHRSMLGTDAQGRFTLYVLISGKQNAVAMPCVSYMDLHTINILLVVVKITDVAVIEQQSYLT